MNTPQVTVKEILESGQFTQVSLGERLQCSQALVSALLNGKRGKRLSFELGSRLQEIHQEVTKRAEPSSSQTTKA